MKELFYDMKVSKLEHGRMLLYCSDAEVAIKDKNMADHELTLRGWVKENKPSLNSQVRITIKIID